ncbi:uncharacterized protein K02A2.6-like isoform X2 [Topomyia yanbarensis]|uniref:uncharacterized protein K02A2.6-like isoform X2 n=1 Tax=Topomyia yanbarensis TaxID=2498891 RepID=UPI00273BFC92|nr:uncharacterized protein K02A2.6-like isoform X2 [Topomyia yanbarensis]
MNNQNIVVEEIDPPIVQQNLSFFSPASYNLPHFKYKHLPPSEIRNSWISWIRWFESIMAAANIHDGLNKKVQLLAMGGLELQSAFYGIPERDDFGDPNADPYLVAKEKLTNHFSPKHHDSFERFMFWTMKPDEDEPIEKFALKVQQKADKCFFGKTEVDSRHIAVIDKIIQYSPDELRQKLLEREDLTLDDTIKIVNAYQSVRYQSSRMVLKPSVDTVSRIYSSTQRSNVRCMRCGYKLHNNQNQCPAINKTCLKCQKTGHFQSVCKSKSKSVINQVPFDRNSERKRKQPFVNFQGVSHSSKRPRNVFNVEERDQESTERENLPVYNVGMGDDELITCRVGGVDIVMLIDSGSKHNLIDDKTWELMKLRDVETTNERKDTAKQFLAYGKIPLKLITAFDAVLEIDDGGNLLKTQTSFYVIEKGQQPLLGKLTAQQLGLLRIGLPSAYDDTINLVDATRKSFPKMRGIKLSLPIDRSVPPVIQPLRRCPIPLLQKVKSKLDELIEMDIIEKVVSPTSWVSPLVPILKENGELRLCIDMRRANQAIQRLNHPLPIIDDFLPKFQNAKFFTSLDIKQAFHQVELVEDCRDVTTFITNWGLFRYKRLLFGVNCAPELFQNLMESILAGCKNTVIFIDDIVIFGSTEQEHDDAVKQTLSVLKQYGILLNDHKCNIKQREIVFLGHKFTAEGISPTEEKIESIKQSRAPRSKEELRSFLGLVTYVSRFIPNLATLNFPLRELIKQDLPFEWKSEHQKSFDQLKDLIGSTKHLGYYDPKDRTLVVTDASGVGLGAVLIQFKENIPRIISYASKSLTETEKKYPAIEKEALGIVWAVERFRIYLMGITFELETDHRPLETLFSVTSRPTARIERWLLRIQAFKFKVGSNSKVNVCYVHTGKFISQVVYRKGSANIADVLSRLASHVGDNQWTDESEVFIRRIVAVSLATLTNTGYRDSFDFGTDTIIRAIQECAAIDISEVVQATSLDPELQKLKDCILSDKWDQEDLKHYTVFRNEYSYVNNLLMRGTKLVIPSSLRHRMCQLAHEGHPGQSMMKRRLRERCWWPGIDQEAVKICESCEGCRLVQIPDPPEPMKRRVLPDKPWIDIAIDFLGPMPTSEYILVVIDYYSRYMELEIMTKITARETIERLRRIFRVWGPPRTITLDNAKQFVSTDLDDFCRISGIHLNHTTPYWPQANGEVERQNRSLLKRMKIANALYGNWKAELDHYLQLYNSTPHTITGKSPSELLQNRKLRTKLPQLDDLETVPPCSDFRDKDYEMKTLGKDREDKKRKAKVSEISVGDTVIMKNLLPTNKLATSFLKEKFTVIDRRGTNVTIQSAESGKIYDRNTSHLKLLPASFNEVADSCREHQKTNQSKQGRSESSSTGNDLTIPVESSTDLGQFKMVKSSLASDPIRRSQRIHKPSARYSPSL